MGNESNKIPVITVGEYAGTPIDQLPVSYCRWMLGQDFPEEWMLIAKKKVEASPLYNEHMSVSRHALDNFSVRFLYLWTAYKFSRKDEPYDGIATFLVKQASEAWQHGEDISKKRHKKDGIIKRYNGVKYVFNQSKMFPEYKDLITVM